MNIHNPEIHHRRSIRLKNYDYSQPGAYFVTINVYGVRAQHAVPLRFGEITDGIMNLNEFGSVVQSCWRELQIHFLNVHIDVFVIMPNHFHGIIILNSVIAMTDRDVGKGRGTARRAPTETFGKPVSHSLPTIVRSFKSAATKEINALRGTPAAPVWQRNYYEHVIRNEAELNQIRKYINDNPLKWATDRDNPDCVR